MLHLLPREAVVQPFSIGWPESISKREVSGESKSLGGCGCGKETTNGGFSNY
jgi:hypothetical protein